MSYINIHTYHLRKSLRTDKISPLNFKVLYIAGYGGGQRYYHIEYKSYYGGPATILCLPDNPELTNQTFSTTNILEGVEFEGSGFAPDALNEDMPCSVCRSSSASTTIMIPGRSTCYSGWTHQYNGVLASGSPAHSSSSYICVDEHPDYIVSGQSNDGGRELYVVAYKCGSLPCPPYHNNRKASCVVCSK